MKGYSIYRDNTVIYEFVVDDTISKSLSGNKYVSFTISSKNDLDLKIGDYVLVGNEKYEIFGPIDIEESNGVFTYPLTSKTFAATERIRPNTIAIAPRTRTAKMIFSIFHYPPYTGQTCRPEKPMNARAIRPAVISAMGKPSKHLG